MEIIEIPSEVRGVEGPPGSGTDTNDYADALAVDIMGQELTVTVGRTGSLDDLTDTATIPSAAALDAEDRGRLNSVDGLVAKTADLSIEAVAHSWANVAALANGGFVAHNEIPTTAQYPLIVH